MTTPTGTCNVEAMSSLKSKLNTMISQQQSKNAAISQAVYEPASSFPPPAAPSPPPSTGSCAKLWAQCGGKTFKGATCCQTGSACQYQNSYYSQCRN